MLLLTCALLLATVAPAHAYIDPGSGLLLWQLFVSAFVGTVVYQYRRIVTFIFRKQRNKKSLMSSLRDPSGRLFTAGKRVLRMVNGPAMPDVMGSGRTPRKLQRHFSAYWHGSEDDLGA